MNLSLLLPLAGYITTRVRLTSLTLLAFSCLSVQVAAAQSFQYGGALQGSFTHLQAGDLDGDGDLDLAGRQSSNEIVWLENDGSGGFSAPAVIALDSALNMLKVIDMDQDGDLDILGSTFYDGQVWWLENLGGGTFAHRAALVSPGGGPHQFDIGDVDNDGDLDLCVALWSSGVKLHINNGMSFTTGGAVPFPYGLRVRFADLNGDGNLDVMYSRFDLSEFHWAAGDGIGSLGPSSVISQGDGAAAIDMDLDGDLDLVITHANNYTVAENDGSGGFSTTVDVLSAWGPFTPWVADFDRDGIPDLILGSGGYWARLYFGDGNVALGTYEDLGHGNLSSFADIDADGDVDIILSDGWLKNVIIDDCNNNGIHDPFDIQAGTSADCDSNGVPDECQLANSGDCDQNGLLDACEILNDPSLDCDGNLNLDVCDLAGDMSLDWNGDGVLDVCSPANYCYSNLNQGGLFGAISVEGTPLIVANDFTMIGENLPVNVFGYFLFSQNQGILDPFGGGIGVLCLGAPIKRFNSALDGGGVLNSGLDGVMSLSADLSGLPQGVVLQAGDTWNFQLWHREFDPSTGAPTSNTTDGIQVMFR